MNAFDITLIVLATIAAELWIYTAVMAVRIWHRTGRVERALKAEQ